MQLPTNCDLYINDCVSDPTDWNNPINFNNPNIHVCRSYGIHPKTTAPKAFFSRINGHLVEIANQFPIGGYGPIGTTILANDTDSTPNVEKILKDHGRIQNSANTPIMVYNLESDIEVNQCIKKLGINHITPIVWQNVNHSVERFNHFVKNILPSNDQYVFSINGKALEYKFAKQVQNSLKNRQILERLLLGTDCPHYPPNYCGKQYSQPLHIANIMLEIHLVMIKSEEFRHFSLADTNDFFTSNAFSVFPKRVFQDLNQRTFDNFVRLRLAPTLNEYRAHIKYLQLNINKSTSTKRSANENIENIPPPKKTFTNSEVQTTQLNDSIVFPDIDLSISKTDSTILPDIEFTPKTQRPLKPIQIDLTNEKTEDEGSNRAKQIMDKALEMKYGDHNDPESPLWNKSNTGSRIQVLKIPKSLVRKMAIDAENMDDEEFNEYLSKLG